MPGLISVSSGVSQLALEFLRGMLLHQNDVTAHAAAMNHMILQRLQYRHAFDFFHIATALNASESLTRVVHASTPIFRPGETSNAQMRSQFDGMSLPTAFRARTVNAKQLN